jgi:hypothetical protein
MPPLPKFQDHNCGNGPKRSHFRQSKKLNERYYHRLAMEEFEKIRMLVGNENHEKQNTDSAEQLLDIPINDTPSNF